MSLSCGHAIVYRQTVAHRPVCLACTPPVGRRAYTIGLALPGGRILTLADIRQQQLVTNRRGRERVLLAHMSEAWPEGDWVLAPPEERDCDGWPRYSVGGVVYHKKLV